MTWVQILEIASCRNVGKNYVQKTQSGRTLHKQELRAPECPFSVQRTWNIKRQMTNDNETIVWILRHFMLFRMAINIVEWDLAGQPMMITAAAKEEKIYSTLGHHDGIITWACECASYQIACEQFHLWVPGRKIDRKLYGCWVACLFDYVTRWLDSSQDGVRPFLQYTSQAALAAFQCREAFPEEVEGSHGCDETKYMIGQ
jgi:hypothetical protein